MSSIIKNFDTVERVIETSQNSAGSALRENEVYLNSIQGKLDKLSNSTQTMWMNFMDSRVLKFLIDVANGLVNIADKVGLLNVAVAARIAKTAFKSNRFGVLNWYTNKKNKTTISPTATQNSAESKAQDLDTAATERNTAATNANIEAEQRSVQASSNSAAADNAEAQASANAAAADSAEAMASNTEAAADGAEAASSSAAATADAAETASSTASMTADIAEAEASIQAAAADAAEQVASEGAAAADAAEATASNMAAAGDAAEGASVGIHMLAGGLKAGSTAFKLFNAATTMGISLLAGFAIEKLFLPWLDDFIHRAENTKERVQDLTKSYKEAEQEFSKNIKTLTESSNTEQYETLLDEFQKLTEGVDRYGNNISLASDEYERYKNICETMVGINPSIAAGYDSATEAIGNNSGALRQLIELQKEQARLNVAEYISYGAYSDNGNFKDMADNAINAYNTAQESINSAKSKIDGSLRDGFVFNQDYGDTDNYLDDIAKSVMSALGYNDIDSWLNKYYNDFGNFTGYDQWVNDYIDEIISNKEKIINELESFKVTSIEGAKRFLEDSNLNPDIIYDYSSLDEFQEDYSSMILNYENGIDAAIASVKDGIDAYETGENALKDASYGMIDIFLQVPYALKDYEKLSQGSKSLLTEWIKNSDAFKIDKNTSQEAILAAKQDIINMVNDLANNKYIVKTDSGRTFTAQSILDQMFDLDPSDYNFGQYKEKMQELVKLLWNAITDEDGNNEFGFENENELAISLGFKFVMGDEDSKYKDFKNDVNKWTGASLEDIQTWLDSLPPEVVTRLVEFDWTSVNKEGFKNEDGTPNFSAILDAIGQSQGAISSVNAVSTYADLSEKASKYNDIIEETNKISADNIEVTQDYKDSLKELGISETELAECFDDANGLIVKNSKALRKLVEQKKKELASDTKLAKAQSQLEYYDLVKQLNSTLNGIEKLDSATMSTVDSIMKNIDVVQRAIYQYQLLEDSLLGTTSAFEKYKQAQEIDNQNTYGDDYVSMAQTMYDAFYKTGEVGSQANWEAIQALIPPEVYQSLKDEGDQLKAIYDYFNKNVLPTLTLKDDQFSLDYDAVENFVEKGMGKIFTKDITADGKTNLDLVEGMNLEKAAELMGMTETQAYAMFAALDKFNFNGGGSSFLEKLDDSTAGDLMRITNEIEDLNKQKIALLASGGYEENKDQIDEINQKLNENQTELQKLEAQSYQTWQKYTQNDVALQALAAIENKQQLLTEEMAKSLGINWDENKGKTVQQIYDELLLKQSQLEEPTVLTAQLAIDGIDSKIESLYGMLNDPQTLKIEAEASGQSVEEVKADIEAKIRGLQEDKLSIATTFGIELSEEDKATLEEQLGAIEQFTINDKTFTVIANGISQTNNQLISVKRYLDSLKDKTINVQTKQSIVGGGGGHYSPANGTAHVQGTAYKGGDWGAQSTDKQSLVGELGPEILVRNGRWHTVGDNGAEFTEVKKGDIIFNHKQTEELLKNGHVTGRGRAFAEGNAYALWKPTSPDKKLSNTAGSEISNASGKLSQAAKDLSKSSDQLSDDFKEIFDWIEVRIEEITESIDLMSAKLENAIGSSKQNAIINDMISMNRELYDNLTAGASKYYEFSAQLLEKVPVEYREAAQDGAIAIESFTGKVAESTLEAIQDYREWVQKGADLTQQAEETLTEISNLAKQAIDNIASDYENKISIPNSKIDQYDAYNSLLETDVGYESEKIYQAIIEENNKNISTLQKQRDEMQAELNKQVEAGNIKKYSQDWYDAVNAIAEVDTQIIELRTDTEDYQDAINELHWDKFDDLMSRLEAVSDEAENLIDILSSKDLVNKDTGEWTKEGITTLGLYAQKMEAAEVQAKKYEEEIKYLNKNWKKLGYTEQEYVEKLEDLKSSQYDAIKAYEDTKNAIVDLNKERVDAIKNGIQKEIDAYQELIDKKKEELDTERDIYDFQKNVKKQQKDIADIQRKLLALSGDNSASARAQRAKLQAELAEAQAELEDTYYERGVEKQQEALDTELENFQNAKQDEMDGWDEYLENTNQVVSDSLATIQTNTDVVYQTLKSMGKEYGLSITESLTSPWKEGENAIQSFSETFGISMSATVEELEALEIKFKETMLEIEQSGIKAVNTVQESAEKYQQATQQNPPASSGGASPGGSGSSGSSGGGNSSGGGVSYPYGKASETSGNIKKGAKGNAVKAIQYALNQLGYGNSGTSKVDGIFGSGTQKAVKAFQKAMGISADGIVGKNTRAKFKLQGYASGTTGVKKDQLALIDELGEELVINVQDGKLKYLSKGSGVVPADFTSNLMDWGAINPQDMLDRNRPSTGVAPSIINNNVEFKIDASVGTLLKIDEFNGDDPDEVLKMINKALDQHTKNLNSALRRYTR